MPFPIPALPVVILNGQSLSSSTAVGHGALVSIIVPESWEDEAPITFQGSIDGVTFFDIYDYLGNEVTVQADELRMIAVDEFIGAPWMKVRSGTAADPVAQTGDITLLLVVQKLPAAL